MTKLVLLLLVSISNVAANELVYTPINPSFGGNPLNGNVLLNEAQAQDDNRDPAASNGQQSALQSFNDMLQRAILSRVASSVTSSLIGANGQLMPGRVETSDFVINVVDIGGGQLQITTTDKATGQTTQFQVSAKRCAHS